MEAKIEKEITVILTMTQKEAQWLRRVMQNPLDGKGIVNEDSTNAVMRKVLWQALDQEGINS